MKVALTSGVDVVDEISVPVFGIATNEADILIDSEDGFIGSLPADAVHIVFF